MTRSRESRRSRGSAPPVARDGALEQMRARAARILGVAAQMTSAGLSTVLLGMARGSEAACRTLLDPILGPDPRFAIDGAGRWTLSEAAAAYGEAPAGVPLREAAWVVWVFHPAAHTLAGVRLENGVRTAGERVSTQTLTARTSERLGRLGAAAHWITTRSYFPRPRAEAGSRRGRGMREWDVLASLPEGRGSLVVDRVVLDLRRIAMLALSSPPRPPAALPDPRSNLERATRRRALDVIGRQEASAHPRSLSALAAALDLPERALDDPLDLAGQAGECLLALLDRPPLSTMSLTRLIEAMTARPTPFDFHGKDFDAAFLSDLPDDPGAYRFFDRAGELVYVGKAKSLRRRVQSYFAARSKPDPRTASWIAKVHRIEIETTGSELQALLREAELIARKNPAANVQRDVHLRERRRPRSPGPAEPSISPTPGDLVLLLPDPTPGVARASLIRNGSLAGRVALGPGRKGLSALRKRIDTLYFLPDASRERRARTKSQDRDRAILTSWLRRQPESLPAFDPTDAPTAAAAADLALRYAHSLRTGDTQVFHRYRRLE